MAAKPTSDFYFTTVRVPRAVQGRLKAEQARRTLETGKSYTMEALASELLTEAAERLAAPVTA